MMIRTLATPEQMAAFRQGLRRHLTVPKIGTGSKEPFRPLVTGCVSEWPDGWEIQIPVYTPSDAAQNRGHFRKNGRIGDEVKQTVGLALLALRQIERERIEHFTMVRISPNGSNPKNNMDDDNLGATLKHVRDPVARWIVEGGDMIGLNGKVKPRGIGNFDRQLKQRGVTWDYQQETNAEDRRRHGVRIHFRLRPSSASSMPKP